MATNWQKEMLHLNLTERAEKPIDKNVVYYNESEIKKVKDGNK